MTSLSPRMYVCVCVCLCYICSIPSLPAPPISSLCPSEFPGDFISPIPNWIRTQFAVPCVTSRFKTRHLIYRRYKELQNEQNCIHQNCFPASGFLSLLCFASPPLLSSPGERWADGGVHHTIITAVGSAPREELAFLTAN